MLRDAAGLARTVPFGNLLPPGEVRSKIKDLFEEVAGMTKAA